MLEELRHSLEVQPELPKHALVVMTSGLSAP